MAGIYVHIPFCRKACHYCNFHFSTSLQQTDAMVTAICKEAELRRNYINEKVATLYFGGGTPSLLKIEDLILKIENLRRLFMVDEDAEIILEANPDDITIEKLNGWKACGINRLSIGVQSFFDEDLLSMNRVHNAAQALNCIELAQQEGFNNISIDLIYGTPGLSDERLRQNVKTAISLGIPHLSCYALTIEKGTALEKMIRNNKIKNIDADRQSRQFELLMQWISEAGYEHYEISNFAKPGFRSKHNSSYWQGKSYLGLGPSAHSYNGAARQWNIANNTLYIKSIEQGILPFEIEHLTSTQKLNEYIMTSLRTMEGLSLQYTAENWNKDAVNELGKDSEKFLTNGLMHRKNEHLILTNKGKLFADGIASEMFIPETSNLAEKDQSLMM
ncbi:MAG: radical SAM family heme chaperone HemW [Parafilimonas sp.]